MAHFAQLDENNRVISVIVVHDNDASTEEIGQRFLVAHGYKGSFKQTSYNNNFRKNFAGPGYLYDAERDAFIAPQPFASWILNEESCRWETPVDYPSDGDSYVWNEATKSWVEVSAG